jgi:hypothetical protein
MLQATVWVDEQGNTISAPVTGAPQATVTGDVKPGVFNEPTSTQAPAVQTPAPSSEEAPAAPSTPETSTVQVASVTPPAPVTPPSPTSVAAPESTTPVAPSPPAVQSAVADTSSAPASGGGSSNGECSSGSPCSGDITFYQAGLGACGETTDGSTDKVVALPHEFMGEQSNGNPFCGKTVTINYNGKEVQATVVDKCMGCVGRDLDLSNAAFDGLGIAESVGRTQADWYFN